MGASRFGGFLATSSQAVRRKFKDAARPVHALPGVQTYAKVWCAKKFLDSMCKCLHFGGWTSLICYKMHGQHVQVSIFWSLDNQQKFDVL